MKITLDINDNKASAFLNFVKSLDFIKIQDYKGTQNTDVPAWQMKETEKRFKELEKHPEKSIDFNKTIEKLEKKYGL